MALDGFLLEFLSPLPNLLDGIVSSLHCCVVLIERSQLGVYPIVMDAQEKEVNESENQADRAIDELKCLYKHIVLVFSILMPVRASFTILSLIVVAFDCLVSCCQPLL